VERRASDCRVGPQIACVRGPAVFIEYDIHDLVVFAAWPKSPDDANEEILPPIVMKTEERPAGSQSRPRASGLWRRALP
jgi:hypothetical protein